VANKKQLFLIVSTQTCRKQIRKFAGTRCESRTKNEELHLARRLFGLSLPPYLGIDPTAAASSIDAIYAALGCTTWTNVENRGCDNRKMRIHFMSESWMFARRDLLDDLSIEYKARRTSSPH